MRGTHHSTIPGLLTPRCPPGAAVRIDCQGYSMLRFIVSRLLTAIPTLLIVSIAVFTLVRLIPGDPASLMLGDLADDAAYAALRQRMGLDEPIAVQFFIWLGNLFQGDLGVSVT